MKFRILPGYDDWYLSHFNGFLLIGEGDVVQNEHPRRFDTNSLGDECEFVRKGSFVAKIPLRFLELVID